MLWHEAIAGRTAQDVTATYLKVIKVTGEQEYTFWVDNCGGQNKNWFLYTILAKLVGMFLE